MARAVNFSATLLPLLLLFFSVGVRDGTCEIPGEETGPRGPFILENSKKVVKTDGGVVRLVTGHRWKGDPNPMHVGFIGMEPNTLFIPQYIDSDIVVFVRHGEAKIGWIHQDEMVERRLRPGDLNTIPAGSTFYIVNRAREERLQIICSFDSSESLGLGSYQSFFVGGGTYPTSILSGFDEKTLVAAFNVTAEELQPLMRRQFGGPIIHLRDIKIEDEEVEEGKRTWSWRKLLDYIVGSEDHGCGMKDDHAHSPHSYNLYDRKPSFENSHGWSIAIDEDDYSPLQRTGTGVFLVNLTSGSMLAPHVNPTATEYGILLEGSGTIQVVFPNGTTAMNAEVREGDVFWIPRYFPFCQVASSDSPMIFFGFTTSSRKNRPQFLVGASSILRSMNGAEMAAGFGVSKKRFGQLVKAQKESVILPTWSHSKETKRGVEVA